MLPSFPTSTHDISTTVPNLITPNLIEKSPKEAAGALVTLLSDNRGSNAPDGFTIRATTPQDRLQIVQRMMQHGSPAYLSAFTNHTRGREILATWLSDATPPRKSDMEDISDMYATVVEPLLALLLRLPIELEHLKDHVGLGKLITGAQKRLRSEHARKLADEVKEKWSALVPSSTASRAQSAPPLSTTVKRPAATNSLQDPTTKRARSNSASTAVPPTRSAVGASVRPASSMLMSGTSRARTASASTQSERRGSPQISDAKPLTSSSAATRRSVSSRSASAQSNANRDLASFMTLIDQPRPSPPPTASASAPVSAGEASSTSSVESGTQPKKRKKTVHWRDHDGQALVAVKLIEPAVYEEDEQGGIASVGQLDMEEGGAFRLAHADMEEYIDYYPPREVSLSVLSPMIPECGAHSEAKQIQAEYENDVAEVTYSEPSMIPESPAEPVQDAYLSAFSTTLNEPRVMTTGSVIRPFVFDQISSPSVSTSSSSSIPGLPSNLADLLQQLKDESTTATSSPTTSLTAPTLSEVPKTPPAAMPMPMPVPTSQPSMPSDAPTNESTIPLPLPLSPWGGLPGMLPPPWPFPSLPTSEAMTTMQTTVAPMNMPEPDSKTPSETTRSRAGRPKRTGKYSRPLEGNRQNDRFPYRHG